MRRREEEFGGCKSLKGYMKELQKHKYAQTHIYAHMHLHALWGLAEVNNGISQAVNNHCPKNLCFFFFKRILGQRLQKPVNKPMDASVCVCVCFFACMWRKWGRNEPLIFDRERKTLTH